MNKYQTAKLHLSQNCSKLIDNLSTISIPFNFNDIIEIYKNIQIIPYSVFIIQRKLTYQEVVSLFKSDDAFTTYDANKNRYLILFNDIDKSFIRSNRYRFSLAHEFGHIFLKHLVDDKFAYLSSNISDKEYREYETQADKFAIKLLCPFVSFKQYNITSSNDIERIYQISGQSAKIAFENYQKWLYNRNITHIKQLKYQQIIKDKFDLSVYKKIRESYNQSYAF